VADRTDDREDDRDGDRDGGRQDDRQAGGESTEEGAGQRAGGTGRLPLFPLETVLFPGVVLPLHVFEPRYRALVRHLIDQPPGRQREFGVVAIRYGTESGPHGSDALYPVGCTAELRSVTPYDDGRYDIVTVGRRRFRLTTVDDGAAPYLCADVEWLPDATGDPTAADRLAPNVLATFRAYLRLLAQISAGRDGGRTAAGADAGSEQLPEDPVVLSHLVAATASLTVADRQLLLAVTDTASRLRAELTLLRREISLLDRLHAVPVPLTELQSATGPN
jgi:Lon protease-like protein